MRSQEDYIRRVGGYAEDERRLVVGALVGNDLAGYADASAVDGCLYGWNIYVHSDHMNLNVTTGLQFAIFQAFRRTGRVSVVVNGEHTPENPGLMIYKERLGFEVVRVPTRLWMVPAARSLLRRRGDLFYYRLTGELSRDAGR